MGGIESLGYNLREAKKYLRENKLCRDGRDNFCPKLGWVGKAKGGMEGRKYGHEHQRLE